MSFSDFLVVEKYYNQVSPPTGSSVLNSILSSQLITPLTSSIQCRGFNHEGLSERRTRADFFISSSVSSSQYVNIEDTKSVSLRIWARTYKDAGYPYGSYNNDRITLYAKHSPYNSYYNDNQSNGNFNSLSGYEMSLYVWNDGNYARNRIQIDFAAGGYYGQMQQTSYVLAEYSAYAGYKPPIPWIGMRMDIVPVKISRMINDIPQLSIFKDIVTLYTADVSDPDNWTQLDRKEFLTNDSKFVPWGNYTVQNNGQYGHGQPVLTSSYGFGVYNNDAGTGNRIYIDDFQMYVIDAF